MIIDHSSQDASLLMSSVLLALILVTALLTTGLVCTAMLSTYQVVPVVSTPVHAMQATCWTLHQLMQHPDCQKRLVAEVKEKLGDRALNDGDLMYDDTRELRYTRACFLEALRLNPPVPMVCMIL